jgi:tRNA G10  N-methylase Trm11
MTPSYAILGTTPNLSILELQTVLTRLDGHQNVVSISPQIARFDSSTDPAVIMSQLGGTVKIAAPVASAPSLPELIELVAKSELFTQKAFAVSASAEIDDLKSLASSLKQAVQARGHRFRFRLLSSLQESSGITTRYEEISFVKTDSHYLCLHTLTVQSLQKWTNKDFGRPKSDPHSGMLPPKVARMMVNCALPQPLSPEIVVYDPFCGTGTILNEALDLGVSVIGSDIDSKAVAFATHNTAWLKDSYQVPGSSKLFVSDVLEVTPKQVQADAIVFEGYLGPPNIKPEKIANYHKGLKKFYIGVIKHLAQLQKPGQRLVMAIPEYHSFGQVKSFHDLIDSSEKYGYTQVAKAITYGRAHATVKRTISVLQKQSDGRKISS